MQPNGVLNINIKIYRIIFYPYIVVIKFSAFKYFFKAKLLQKVLLITILVTMFMRPESSGSP